MAQRYSCNISRLARLLLRLIVNGKQNCAIGSLSQSPYLGVAWVPRQGIVPI